MIPSDASQFSLLPLLSLTSKAFDRGVTRVVMLALLTAGIWCWQHDRLVGANWSVPLDYTGDSLEILARIKAAAEGDLVPFGAHVLHRLGAPFGADWTEYPGSDDLANFALGQIARVIGVAAASNLALLLAHVTAALAFYGCARLLRHRWDWAFAGALLFAFSFFSLSRGLPHLWLTFTYTVPLALLTCGLIAAARRTPMRRTWRWLCYATAAVLGASNPYNLFLYLQLLAWAVLARWWRSGWLAPQRRSWSREVRLGLACGLVAVAVCAAIHARIEYGTAGGNDAPLLVRNYAGTEIYGLKPIELVLPPSRHHSPWLAALGHRYLRWTDWRGEAFSPYLGLVGAAGLLWMFAALARSLLARSRPRLSGPALPAAWILLFSVIGGVNSILAFYLGLDLFRATNRYSIFLLALALLFLVARLSRLTRTWRPAVRLGAVGAVVVVGLWDQLPVRTGRDASRRIAEQVNADRRLGEVLEQRLGPRAMVFQLPVLDFPEGRPQLGVNEYDHFRPYIATRTLRFSYGEPKGRARGTWQRDCSRMTPADLIQTLEGAGFAGLYFNPRGYPDGAAGLLAELASAGRAEIIQEPGEGPGVVRLRPAEHPQPPVARSLTFGVGWNRRAPDEASDAPHWTNGPAALSFYNPFPQALVAPARLVLSSAGERTVRLIVNGREQTRLRVSAEPQELDLPAVELRPGINRLELDTAEPAIRVSEQRLKLRAIAVRQFQLRPPGQPNVDLGDEPAPAGAGGEAVPPGDPGRS